MIRPVVQEEPSPPEAVAFYRLALEALIAARLPFLVGGAYALQAYAGIIRRTKDFDIFVRPEDCAQVLELLVKENYETELTHPHWIAKVRSNSYFIDVIYNSGNGICAVDADWFAHAPTATVVGLTLKLAPPEEMIWQKAFVMTRERYDGADVVHILRACADTLDWHRLLGRFGNNVAVLLSHLILFGYVYPTEQHRVPAWVIDDIINRLKLERGNIIVDRLCRGTLFSVVDYQIDINTWGYEDARLIPWGNMTPEDVAQWSEPFREMASLQHAVDERTPPAGS